MSKGPFRENHTKNSSRHSQKLFDITSEKYKRTFFELSNRYFFPIVKLPESKMWQAPVKAKTSNYETTVNAVTHTIPVVTTLLVITASSEMLLTIGLDNKLRYPAAK